MRDNFLNLLLFLIYFLINLIPINAIGSIRVSTLRVDFTQEGNQFQDVFVQNTGDSIEYVDLQLFKRTHPAQDSSLIENSEGQDPEKFGMVVTPTKMALNPGQTKRVRLLNFNHGNTTDIVYGLKVLPVASPILGSKEVTQEHLTVSEVKLITAYLIGVFVLPANPSVNLSLHRNGKNLMIENTGTTNALLDKGRQCTTAKPPVCTDLGDLRIYAKETHTLSLPQELPVTYQASYLDQWVNVSSN